MHPLRVKYLALTQRWVVLDPPDYDKKLALFGATFPRCGQHRPTWAHFGPSDGSRSYYSTLFEQCWGNVGAVGATSDLAGSPGVTFGSCGRQSFRNSSRQPYHRCHSRVFRGRRHRKAGQRARSPAGLSPRIWPNSVSNSMDLETHRCARDHVLHVWDCARDHVPHVEGPTAAWPGQALLAPEFAIRSRCVKRCRWNRFPSNS